MPFEKTGKKYHIVCGWLMNKILPREFYEAAETKHYQVDSKTEEKGL